MKMKLLLVIFAALPLTGCDLQSDSAAATKAELASINQHIATLSARISMLENTVRTQRTSDWILWQVNGSTYPQAFSGYTSKSECLVAAGSWTFPGGKQVSQDPDVFQMKGSRVSMECLPIGVKPYAH